jgi:hypothetical protein
MANTLISTHFPSIGDFLETILASKIGTCWLEFKPNTHSLKSYACAQSLDAWCAQARSYAGLEPTIEKIEHLATGLLPSLPTVTDVRRQRVWGKQGSTLNPHRVLRGATKAWRRLEPAPKIRQALTASLLLPCWYPARMSENEILWTNIANAAYALALQKAGISLELVAFPPSETVWESPDGLKDHALTITVKALGSTWNMQALALIAQPGFLRRGIFRLYEAMIPAHGPIYHNGYGHLMPESQYPTTLAHHTSWTPAQATLYGASAYSRISEESSARAWLEVRLAQSENLLAV